MSIIINHTRIWINQPTTKGFWWLKVSKDEIPTIVEIVTTENDFPINPVTSKIHFMTGYYGYQTNDLKEFMTNNNHSVFQKVRQYD